MGFSRGARPRFVTPKYDWEDFRSFLTIFRKIAVAEGESIYLPKIINVVSRYGDAQIRDYLKNSKRHITSIVEGRAGVLRWGIKRPHGNLEYTGRRILDVLINGIIFHEGPDKASDVQILQAVDRECHIFLVTWEIVMPVLNYCIVLRNIIWQQNLFPRSEFPPIRKRRARRTRPDHSS
jgi:hypothetical protein